MAKQTVKDVEVHHAGKQILLPGDPKEMSIDEGIQWLQKKKAEQEQGVRVIEEIKGFHYDCAYALSLAVKKLYGFNEKMKIPGSFFRPDQPPQYVNLPIDHTGKTVEVFVGRFAIPGVEGYVTTQLTRTGMNLVADVRAKNRKQVQELAEECRAQLKLHSLYRNKAIEVNWNPNLEEGGVDMEPPQFIAPFRGLPVRLNKTTLDAVDAAIWTVVKYPAQVKKAGVKMRKGTLLYGPYGTGKSLVARITADMAEEYEWTFLYCRQPESLMRAFEFARTMGTRTIIFCEDFDVIVERNDQNALQNLLDGVDTKGLDIILILTTNHAEKIPPALMRDGRIDAAIPFMPPDAETAIQLVQDFAGDKMAPGQDLDAVGRQLEGLKPAIICGIVETATLHALRLSSGQSAQLTAEAIMASARAKQAHIEMIEREAPRKISAFEQFADVIGAHLALGMMRAMGQFGASPEEGGPERLSPKNNRQVRGWVEKAAERNLLATNGQIKE